MEQESWRVAGLAGTGSKDVLVADAFVPEYRTHSSTQVHEHADPGRVVNDRPLYRLPWSCVFPLRDRIAGHRRRHRARWSCSSRTIGSGFRSRAAARYRPSADLHLRLAESLTEVEAAHTRLTQTWQDFQARVTRGEEIPYVLRARCRYDAAHAIAHCAGAVFRVLEVNGGRTMNAGGAFQRLFRDLLAMRNHISGTLEVNASTYALAKLGAPPPPFNRAQRVVV